MKYIVPEDTKMIMKRDNTNGTEKFEIFPYSFLRYASGNHIDFEQLKCNSVESFTEKISTMGLETDLLRDKLCDYLHALVKEAHAPSDKQLFIDLKRDIYNSRNITPSNQVKLLEKLNQKNKDLFEQYIVLKEKKEKLLINWNDRYINTITEHRGIVQELSKNELFQKGVRVSSKVFYNQLAIFLKKTVPTFGKKEARLEYSLLRYLTRMYFKTSPFSTFTNLGICNLIETGDIYSLAKGKIHSKIRLNNGIFDYLKTLLVLHPEINGYLYLKINPTTQVIKDKVSFLINFHNLESFQNIAYTGVIQLLLEIAKQKESLKMYEFIEKLQESIDGNTQEIKEYLLKLVEIGLLEFDFQTSGTDPDWSSKLLNFLRQIKSSSQSLKQTISVLEKQHVCCEIYATSNIKERNIILEEMFKDFSMLFEHFLEDMNIFKKDYKAYKENYKSLFTTERFKKHPYILPSLTTEKLIYEDSFIQEKGEVSKTLLTTIIKNINNLIDLLQPLDSFQEERSRIQSFYISYYGKKAETPLLDFYHLYYLHIKKPQQDLKNNNTDEYIDEHQENYNQTYRKWIEDFKCILKPIMDKNEDEIHVDVNMLKTMQEQWKSNRNRKTSLISRGMFMQVFYVENKFQVVVNSISQGMGRACGRFLHLFDPNVTEDLKKYNAKNTKESLFMELSDGSYFNANSHPPLLDHEIKIPDGHTSLSIESQIAVKDILVYFDEDIQEVCLKHSATDKRILPFDLCLESLDHRSKLYQLLSCFSPEQAISFKPIQIAVQELLFDTKENPIKREIYRFPRLVYNKQIILKRKRWSVLTKSIPQKGEQQSDADYFLSINQWKQKHNFPDQIFLYLRANSTTKEEDAADDYKPQYICFNSPLLIILWNKLLKKAKEYIYFEEMSPDTKTLKQQSVNELLVQWYFK